jgi:ABC-type branched-subunit amino acid transport system ATPase component
MTAAEGLVAQNLTVRYGGLTAVSGQSLNAPTRRITGLIGPNGAGKTTTFNAISGVVRPAEGSVHLFGEDITRLPPQTRALRGLGRTFQRMELFENLSVRENVAMGSEAALAARRPADLSTGQRRLVELARVAAGEFRVEHDMALVMSTCGYIYVLDFGKPIFEGTPREVQSSPLVRSAYLGSEAPELADDEVGV